MGGFLAAFLGPFMALLAPLAGPVALSNISSPETLRTDAQEAISRCVKLSRAQERFDCLDSAAKDLLARSSFRNIDLALSSAQFDCHDLMHNIARNAYLQYGSLAKLYADATFSCFGAAYHGGAEGFILGNNLAGAPIKDVVAAMLPACQDAVGRNSPLYMQCVHGIGHALMFLLAEELPQALEVCDAYPDEGERVNCYGGAFMENIPSSQLSPHESRYAKADDPWYPCPILAEKYRGVCYHFAISRVPEMHPDREPQPSDYLAFCRKVPARYRGQCYKDTGQVIATAAAENQARIAICEGLGDQGASEQCIRGVIRFYLDRYAGVPEKLNGVFDFCASTPAGYKRGCYDEAGQVMAGRITPGSTQEMTDQAHRICAAAGEYEDTCATGIFAKQNPI